MSIDDHHVTYKEMLHHHLLRYDMPFANLGRKMLISSEYDYELECINSYINTQKRIEYLNSDGKYHNEDGPALVRASGTIEYIIHGRFNRKGGPSVITHDGKEYYYINNILHREDGPALILPSGDEYYYWNGLLLSREEHENRVFEEKTKLVKG